ncbi:MULTISPECIES: nitrogen regulation protein NR(I) [unclassified Limnobacter]|uniref:nitrogen regulation protein NR(I) n=1 Tax=unclassified Limnobacter TaxID=2630203 RepID=UPI000C3C8696|nr:MULTISPECIES: nitrogen regulation protein NR(I) [unclassified Limnobacter]MAZ09264.1 nitrogen regulation protein NR(I) [Sutterellaceae bacterium]|tara:strand:+ start:1366 stop:2946 length:1581 start_codon:yes stop_codon:yes gene_type:complete
MRPIWVVDDDHSIRWVLQKAISREGIPCEIFSSAAEVLERLETEVPQVLVSDIRMPGQSGLTLLSKVRELQPDLPVIIMTAYSDLDSAVSAFQGGAFEYLPKPFDIEKAVELILRAVRESQTEEFVEEADSSAPEILGQAPAMQEVFRAIGRLSQSNVTVLITGESGAGKELVARALHRHSPRASKPFIALNTAAIPKDLLESELFGHERGSFTGAQAQRQGRFEQAEGGTLFLDEIGDMPAELQTRLLRVLSDGHFYRVGGQQPIKANVRVIAATHQNLDERVKQGMFREDLYHRLNVIRLRLPPLRERQEDIPILAKHFLNVSARELGTETKRLSDSAIRIISEFPFPGNVRQLENVCRWITVMAPAQLVEARDLPPELKAFQNGGATALEKMSANSPSPNLWLAESNPLLPATATPTLQPNSGMLAGKYPVDTASVDTLVSPPVPVGSASWLELLFIEAEKALESGQPDVMDALTAKFETTMIQAALKATHGKRIEAAQRLGIGRNTITRKIQDLNIDVKDID